MNTEKTMRGEIQGLRAVAVLLVLFFHVWPHALPGGYVGVDVFFVISGYLIVGSLVREVERTGRISLVDFYANRIRRLLPAASAVLAFVFVGVFLWLPPARWESSVIQVAASAIYLENWYLVWSAVDYLASEEAASPVQHYWSLSVEEQFYIAWPLIAIGTALLARRARWRSRHALGCVLAVLFVGSLLTSAILTHGEPASAYFLTYTRIWELALGGLAAIWLPALTVRPAVRAVLCLAGLAAILASGAIYSAATPMPGLAALLPTVGALAIILAGDFRIGRFAGLNAAPLRYVGNISYSLYLWHWPVIVFLQASGFVLDAVIGLSVIAVILAVSHLSYRFIEQPFRQGRRTIGLKPVPFGFASSMMFLIAAGIAYGVLARGPAGPASSANVSVEDYPGPLALSQGAVVPAGVPLRPSAAWLYRDRSEVYDNGCHQDQEDSSVTTCRYGDPNGTFTVALVGSSHSVNWLPAFDLLGKAHDWSVVSATKSSCGFASTDSRSCDEWNRNLIEFLKRERPDLVFASEYVGARLPAANMAALVRRWRAITDLGIPILTINPIPQLAGDPGDCLPDRLTDCLLPRSKAERPDISTDAAKQVPNVFVLDMDDAICSPQTCGATVGNIVVYRDRHHLTATYSRALAPVLEKRIGKAYPGLLPLGEPLVAEPPVERKGAILNCGALGDSPPISRAYDAVVENQKIAMRRGAWQEEDENFEIWTGTIEGRTVHIEGRYREGSPSVKEIDLRGTFADGRVVAGGERGPRTCSLLWTMEPNMTQASRG